LALGGGTVCCADFGGWPLFFGGALGWLISNDLYCSDFVLAARGAALTACSNLTPHSSQCGASLATGALQTGQMYPLKTTPRLPNPSSLPAEKSNSLLELKESDLIGAISGFLKTWNLSSRLTLKFSSFVESFIFLPRLHLSVW
jgi:hypothetical protein